MQVLLSGGRWVDAPACYGPKTLYNRWIRWAKKGVWQRAFETLAAAGGPPAELMLDSTWAKAHRSAAGGKGGRTPTPLRRRSGQAAAGRGAG